MTPFAHHRVLRTLALGLCLHVLAMGYCLWRAHSDMQMSHYRLSLRNNAILVLGSTHSGSYKIWHFATWKEAESFLHSRHLRLPTLSFAEQNMSAEVHTMAPDARNPNHRILWRRGHERWALNTPDAESARVLARHVRFGRLEAGPLGFSLGLLSVGAR